MGGPLHAPTARSLPSSATAFDARAFRHALGHFPTGVTIVTARDADGAPVGITVNSFNSVSLDPPLVLFSVAHASRSLALLAGARHYAVNVLREDQNELSQRFAAPGADKFAALDCRSGLGASPLLREALAVFECEAWARHPAGDHDILVGRVLRFATAAGRPLVFYRGGYDGLRAAHEC